MRFWDSSSIVPLLIREQRTDEMLALFDRDRDIVATFITPIEVTSAVWRRLHRHLLTIDEHRDADLLFADMSRNWISVDDHQQITATALVMLSRYPLRAGDAMQLASAHVALRSAQQKPYTLPFVTLDTDLASAAHEEGFPVLP